MLPPHNKPKNLNIPHRESVHLPGCRETQQRPFSLRESIDVGNSCCHNTLYAQSSELEMENDGKRVLEMEIDRGS